MAAWGYLCLHASACMNARVFTAAQAAKSQQMWRPFQNKVQKSVEKLLCKWPEQKQKYGLLWQFLDVLPWSCLSIFHPCMPQELKKNSLPADSRKELLSQHFSSLPQAEACQPEHRLFHVSPKPHAQVLGSNRPIIQLHRAAKAPQQEMFIWLYCRKMQPSSFSKQRWKGNNNFNKSHLMRWFLNLKGAFAGTAVHM